MKLHVITIRFYLSSPTCQDDRSPGPPALFSQLRQTVSDLIQSWKLKTWNDIHTPTAPTLCFSLHLFGPDKGFFQSLSRNLPHLKTKLWQVYKVSPSDFLCKSDENFKLSYHFGRTSKSLSWILQDFKGSIADLKFTIKVRQKWELVQQLCRTLIDLVRSDFRRSQSGSIGVRRVRSKPLWVRRSPETHFVHLSKHLKVLLCCFMCFNTFFSLLARPVVASTAPCTQVSLWFPIIIHRSGSWCPLITPNMFSISTIL